MWLEVQLWVYTTSWFYIWRIQTNRLDEMNGDVPVFPPGGRYRIELCSLGPNPAWNLDIGVGATWGSEPVLLPMDSCVVSGT